MIFERASREDANEILELYHSVLNSPNCRWSLEYPVMANIEDDLSRDGLFCFKDNGKIIGAISIDLDEAVEKLPFWHAELQPSIELSRLCVSSDYQGQGLAAKLIENMMEYGRKHGIRSIHYLVSKYNLTAQKAYSRLGFQLVGECSMYHDEYFCYEKAL